MLFTTYYSQKYASIIDAYLAQGCGTHKIIYKNNAKYLQINNTENSTPLQYYVFEGVARIK